MEYKVEKWIEILNYVYINKDIENNYLTSIMKNVDVSYCYLFKILKTLRKDGIVIQTINKKSKRIKFISLTENGLILAESCYNIIKTKNELIKK